MQCKKKSKIPHILPIFFPPKTKLKRKYYSICYFSILFYSEMQHSIPNMALAFEMSILIVCHMNAMENEQCTNKSQPFVHPSYAHFNIDTP